jgi:hypothetical protein
MLSDARQRSNSNENHGDSSPITTDKTWALKLPLAFFDAIDEISGIKTSSTERRGNLSLRGSNFLFFGNEWLFEIGNSLKNEPKNEPADADSESCAREPDLFELVFPRSALIDKGAAPFR